MSGERRFFHTLDLVTVYTGIMVTTRGIEAVYELCGYVLGDSGIMTHQLPGASRACKPALLEQHPWLEGLEPPVNDLPALAVWSDDLVDRVGPAQRVSPARGAEWVPGNAMRDLLDIAGDRPVIGVVATDKEEDPS